MHLIFEQSCRSYNPKDTQIKILLILWGRLRGALEVAYTATKGGARIETQTLNLRGLMSQSLHGHLNHELRDGAMGLDSDLCMVGVTHVPT